MLDTIPLSDITGKVIFYRADLNVPLKNGRVDDDTRIALIIPYLKKLCAAGARIILSSHLGRPKGKICPELSLRQLLSTLQDYIEPYHIEFCAAVSGDNVKDHITSLHDGSILLIENLRFDAREEDNDITLAQEWVDIADYYINDAFSCAHRAHASTAAIAHLLPSYAGALLLQEIKALQTCLSNAKKPTIAIVGGAKISTKIAVLENLLDKIDHLIIGGGMANTFMLALGEKIGDSLVEPDFQQIALDILDKARSKNCHIHLPKDHIVAEYFDDNASYKTVMRYNDIKQGMILDSGMKTIAYYRDIIAQGQTILWNGPLGAFEMKNFATASLNIASFIAEKNRCGDLQAIAGGGDTVSLINLAGIKDDLTYISTAGGAFLEFLEGKTLPGIAALES